MFQMWLLQVEGMEGMGWWTMAHITLLPNVTLGLASW